ncbi:Poly A polymerase, head domain [Dillenia turbinata]|uniref:Poly A polymerase, head domain n=1 Tax=Dillenia turbinata TaxID=194707 RepID=A0AAN8V6S8_9MAGN
MTIFNKTNGFFSRLPSTYMKLQRFERTNKEAMHAHFSSKADPDSLARKLQVDISEWKKVDSREFGISRSMISASAWTVFRVLQSHGHQAYFVGGCVRDLLLKKVPKDFDIITTASLRLVRKVLRNSHIVGRRFPICIATVKGAVVEVSSFKTVPAHAKDKETVLISQMPAGCNKKDFILWSNCLRRDFTVNSLFLDPMANRIYDYANGIRDLSFLKLRTLIPARLSFQEDCARILRGFRIAARLGLSFSKEIEIAICELASSIKSLDKVRIMMELNYMLSYGAAAPSLNLLQTFNLLEMLLPFHASYISHQVNRQLSPHSSMLMKLFINLDKLVSSDQPSDSILWIGLLTFHQALVLNPQHALVVWAFSSVLYHGNWKEGVEFARKHARVQVNFAPEILEAMDVKSDEELAKQVSEFTSMVRDHALKLCGDDPESSCLILKFVPRKVSKNVARIFDVQVKEVESYEKERKSLEIDLLLLGKGDIYETRFALGKIIMDTMYSRFSQEEDKLVKEFSSALSDNEKHQLVCNKNKRQSLSLSGTEIEQHTSKKKLRCNLIEEELTRGRRGNMVEESDVKGISKIRGLFENSRNNEMAKKQQKLSIKGNCLGLQEDASYNQPKMVENSDGSRRDKNTLVKNIGHAQQQGTLQHKHKGCWNLKFPPG